MKFDGVLAVALGLLSAGVLVEVQLVGRELKAGPFRDVGSAEQSEIHVEGPRAATRVQPMLPKRTSRTGAKAAGS